MRNQHSSRRGLTLLELLIVVLIMAAIAGAAVSLTDNLDSQSRFDDTRHRVSQIRTATVGDLSRTVNGQPVISGFLADIGRLPNSFSELLERGSLPVWHYEPSVGQSAGWRGPYLPNVLPQRDGSMLFLDGWGNRVGGAHGWKAFTNDTVNGRLYVQSLGSDGVPDHLPTDTSVFAQDYPYRSLAGDPSSPPAPLVDGNDWVNLSESAISISIDNRSGAAWPSASISNIRLRVACPMEGHFAHLAAWPTDTEQRDDQTYLSLAQTINAGDVPEGPGTLTFQFGKHTGTLYAEDSPKLIPPGVRAISVVLDETGAQAHVNLPTLQVTLLPRASLSNINGTAIVIPATPPSDPPDGP